MWDLNSLLLREKLGAECSLLTVRHWARGRVMMRVCLSLSYPTRRSVGVFLVLSRYRSCLASF